MILFGVCVGSDERYRQYARAGIQRCVGEDATVLTRRGHKSIFEAYNSILVEAARRSDLEGLVLLHEDTELRDLALAQKLRDLFADRTIGVAGTIGARNVRSALWWFGELHGRASWNGPPGETRPRVDDYGVETVDVDAVDGFFMALSPWAVRNVAFDAHTFGGFHLYDLDYCFAIRDRGRRVVVSDFAVHHHNRSDPHTFDLPYHRANLRWRVKWKISRFSSPVGLRVQLLALRVRWMMGAGWRLFNVLRTSGAFSRKAE